VTTVIQQEITTAKQKLTTAEHKLANAKHELSAVKHEVTTTKHKLDVAKNELTTAENELASAGHELVSAKHGLTTAEHEIAVAEHKLTTSKHKLTSTKYRLTTIKYKPTVTKDELTAANHEHTSAKHEFTSVEDELAAAGHRLTTAAYRLTTAKHRLPTAESELATAEHKFTTAEANLATVEDRCTTMEDRFTAAEHEFVNAKHKFATTEHEHKAMVLMATALDNLATDCLRLTMHFFHPIQQCAQQVYYTAVPLSPISSQLRESCLQGVVDNQLSPVTAFSGAPHSWGLLLRTIDVRPRQLTCIATSVHRIVAACEDTVIIYDAVTGVVLQSISAPETVIKVQGSPDGSALFFGHSLSVTMWDVQTGGLIHTFTAQSPINDITVSTTGDHIACGLSNGSIKYWGIHTKEEGKSFGGSQPVVTMCWLAPLELAVATQTSVYIHNIAISETSNTLSFLSRFSHFHSFSSKFEAPKHSFKS